MRIEALRQDIPTGKENLPRHILQLSTEFGAPFSCRFDISRYNDEIPAILERTSPEPWARQIIATTVCHPLGAEYGTMWEGFLYQSKEMDPEQVIRVVVDSGIAAIRSLEYRWGRNIDRWDALMRYLNDQRHPLSPHIVDDLQTLMTGFIARFRARRTMIQQKDSASKQYQTDIQELGRHNVALFRPELETVEGALRLVHNSTPDRSVDTSGGKSTLIRNGVADEVIQSLTGDRKRALNLMRGIGLTGYPWGRAVINHT